MSEYPLQESTSSFDWQEKLYAYLYRGKILLKRFWWLLLLTMSLGVVYQAYKELQKEPVYVSNAQLWLSLRINTNAPGTQAQETLVGWFPTQVEILQSGDRQQRAHEAVRALYPELPQNSWANASVHVRGETNIFYLTARGGHREYTQRFLEALIEEYYRFRSQSRERVSTEALLSLRESLVVLESELRDLENDRVEYQTTYNLAYAQEQRAASGRHLVELRSQRTDLQTRLRLLEQLGIDALDQELDLISGENAAQAVRANLADFESTRRELNRLRAERDSFGIFLRPRHPKMIRLNDTIEVQEHTLAVYRRLALDEIEEEKRILSVRIGNLDDDIQEWNEVSLETNQRLAEYEQLERAVQLHRENYDRTAASIESIDLGENLSNEFVNTLREPTDAYEVPNAMKRRMIEGGVAGLALGIGLVLLFGVLDSRVITADDLKQRYDDPVLGIIPLERRSRDGNVELLQPKDTRHLFSEACRTLRSSVLFLETDMGRPQVFVITSAVPSEGKSTVSTNLAAALSFTSSKTLLVDADMRRGHLHKNFQAKAFPGFAEYVLENRPVEEVIHKTEVENLDFIPTGVYPDRPGELLLSERSEELIAYARANYDFVIFDTAPILATDDTSGFSVKSDAVLFVVRAGHTQHRQIRASLDRLNMRGAPLAGFALNFVDTRGADYYYYKKYNEYYAYSTKERSAS